MRCSGLCPRKPRGLVRAFSGALGLKHVICGCCRVTSQKRLSPRLQALNSWFFAVMPPILRIRLDGWFSRCRGQSSGKSASRQRSYERYSRDVNEPRHVRESSRASPRERHAMFQRVEREFKSESKRGICNWRVVFQQSNLLLPTGGLSNPIVRMGRSPAHVQACWVDQQFWDISSLLGRINFIDLYTCIIMQGIKI